MDSCLTTQSVASTKFRTKIIDGLNRKLRPAETCRRHGFSSRQLFYVTLPALSEGRQKIPPRPIADSIRRPQFVVRCLLSAVREV